MNRADKSTEKYYLLLRLDTKTNPRVTEMLQRHIVGDTPPIFINSGTAILTLFKSESRIKTIADDLSGLELRFPYLLFEINQYTLNCHFSPEVVRVIEDYCGISEPSDISSKTRAELEELLQEAIEEENFELCQQIQEVLENR